MPGTQAPIDKPEKVVTHAELLAAISALLEARGVDGANALTADALGKAIGEALNGAMEKSERRISPQNPTPPLISVFSYPEGERARPKPQFLANGAPYDVWLNNSRLDHGQMTPFEVLTVNALRASFASLSTVKLARGEKWRCELREQGRQMYIICPCQSEEDRLEIMATSLVLICKELMEGAAAADPTRLLERMGEMQAQLDALTKSAAPAPAAVG